jgi:hypothetical protein
LKHDVIMTQQGVKPDATLLFNPEPVPVFVKLPNNKVQRIQVNPAWNIWGLRKEIEKQTKFPSKQIEKIMYNGQNLPDDYQSLHDHGLEFDGGTTLHCTEKSTTPTGARKWGPIKTTYLWAGSSMRVDFKDKGMPSAAGARKSTVKKSTMKSGETGALAVVQAGPIIPEEIDEEEEEALAAFWAERQESVAKEAQRSYYEHEDEGYVEPEEIEVPDLGFAFGMAEQDPSKPPADQGTKVRKGDLDYHLLSCCMCCCPCLRPTPAEVDADSDSDSDDEGEGGTALLIAK